MQNLINALMAGTTEYRDGGVQIQHPPTSTQLRAGRVLSELNNQNVANQQLLNNQQHQINTLNDQVNTLMTQLELSNRELLNIKKELENALTPTAAVPNEPAIIDVEPVIEPAATPAAEPTPAQVPGSEHLL